jgi:hypothetical protein
MNSEGESAIMTNETIDGAVAETQTETSPEEEWWAHLEIMGHRDHWGRIKEVHRFGTTFLRIDVPTRDPEVFDTHLYGGNAIFGLRLCSKEKAVAGAARSWPYEAPRGPLLAHEPEEEPDLSEIGEGHDATAGFP